MINKTIPYFLSRLLVDFEDTFDRLFRLNIVIRIQIVMQTNGSIVELTKSIQINQSHGFNMQEYTVDIVEFDELLGVWNVFPSANWYCIVLLNRLPIKITLFLLKTRIVGIRLTLTRKGIV